MKRTVFYNILIITALFAGCKKVDLDPMDGTPVFTAEGKFDDILKTWKAGVDGYYMYSSFEKDQFDVFEFSSSFAQEDSISAGEVLTFIIRDYKQLPEGSPDINTALVQNLHYSSSSGIDTIWGYTLDTVGFSTNFNADSSLIPNTPVIYEWLYGDGSSDSISGQNSQHIYSQLPNSPVTLSIRAINNSCSSSLTKPLFTQANSTYCDMNIEMYYQNPIADSLLIVKAIAKDGIGPFTYIWNNGATSDSLSIQVSTGMVQASVTVTDNNGCIVSGSVSTTISFGTVPPICIAQFTNTPVVALEDSTLIIDSIIVGNTIQLSGVRVEYTDGAGIFYSSHLNSQPSFSSFKIISVEDYDANEKGEKTKKATLEYNCRIWSASGNFIDIKNGKATIALAYP